MIAKILWILGKYSVWFVFQSSYVRCFSPLLSLCKDEHERPKYKKLLEHPFVAKAKEKRQAENVSVYLSDIIDGLEKNTDNFQQYYYLPNNKHWTAFLFYHTFIVNGIQDSL